MPLCVMASLSAEQGGGFALCLMPMHEEAGLGPDPVFPASLGLVPSWSGSATPG